MGIPDDANPLNRCLPAEVVTRQKRETKKQEKEEPSLNVDAKQVHGMKPEVRYKWLGKALGRCAEGKVEKTLIFDIMTNAKFCHDCSSRLGAKMYRLVLAHADLFSPKQRKHLQVGDCPLRKLFKKAESDDAAEGKREAAEAAGERSTDVAKLWEHLCSLSSEQREAEVTNLDDDSKAKLEAFLEARIAATQGTPGPPTSAPAQKSEPERDEEKQKSRKSKGRRSRSRRRRRSSSSEDSRSESSRSRRSRR